MIDDIGNIKSKDQKILGPDIKLVKTFWCKIQEILMKLLTPKQINKLRKDCEFKDNKGKPSIGLCHDGTVLVNKIGGKTIKKLSKKSMEEE